jgi:branched-chain amino acid transport system permease protein
MAISNGMLLKVNKQETATLLMLATSPDTEVGLSHPHARLTRGWAAAIAAIGLAFAVLLGAVPQANAADAGDPSTWEYSIAGTLKQNGDPIKGVDITAVNGSFSNKTTSDEFGSWTIPVPEAGTYKVSLDTKTLPAGFQVENANLEADLTQVSFAAVLFRFAGQTVQTQSFADQLTVRIFAGLNFGLLLAMAAIGISLIFGTTGLSNFAHGEMVTLGALMTWLFHVVGGMNMILSGVLAVIVVAGFGWLQDAGLWRPLRKRRTGLNQMMIVSIGFSIVARYLLLLFFNGDTKDIAGGGNPIDIGPIKTSDVTLVGMVISVITLAGVALFLTRTRVGKATRAVSDNPALASATGIDVERIIRIVWVTAATVTGVAGVLYGLEFQANWLTGFDILLMLFAAVTLGGLGTALGATVGALIIGMVVEVSTLFIPNELKYAAALVILIAILIARPQGVLGKKQRLG